MDVPQRARAAVRPGELAAVHTWLHLADALDLVELTLALADLLNTLDPEWEPAPDLRPRALLLAGRPGAAAEALPSGGFPDAGPLSYEACLQAAVFAALGDDEAYRLLQAAVRETTDAGPAPVHLMYLAATAATSRGDHAVADPLWVQIAELEPFVTDYAAARFVAARVAARTGPGRDRATLLRALARRLDHLVPANSDPEPVLSVVRLLRERGDDAGAALFLLAAYRRVPVPSTPLRDLIAELGPPMPGRHRWRSGWPRMDGPDRAARQWISARDVPRARARSWSLPLLGAGVGLYLGLLGMTGYLQHFDGVPVWRQALTWVLGLAVAPALGWLSVRRLVRVWPGLLTRRLAPGPVTSAPEPPALADLAGCQCLSVRALRGLGGDRYAAEHLVAADSGLPVGRLAHPVRVLACPNTGILWLAVDSVTGATMHLLRGVTP
ncbi:hypothetical protein ACIB24_09145 [Spongisporangium articulatum]|uniref:Uncharacterized protein n=1 Tax=Spongisporangium articulatum TaxID=3362603 RepID=A0ABW8ALH9_9ACTN